MQNHKSYTPLLCEISHKSALFIAKLNKTKHEKPVDNMRVMNVCICLLLSQLLTLNHRADFT